MVCTRIQLPTGQTAIVCGPKPRLKRCACGRPATLLCDWKVPGGTCDRPMCDRCTVSPMSGKDLCREHVEAWKAARV